MSTLLTVLQIGTGWFCFGVVNDDYHYYKQVSKRFRCHIQNSGRQTKEKQKNNTKRFRNENNAP